LKRNRKNVDKNPLVEAIESRITDAILKYGELEFHDVEIEAEELEIVLQPMMHRVVVPVIEKKVKELIKVSFKEPKIEMPGKIVEVKIGATKSEGGTRDRVLIIGGETLPPYYYILGKEVMPHPPIIGADVFDMKIPLPRVVRQHFEDVLDDPIAWAKRWVDKYGAELINIHLVSTDPSIKDTPPSESAKLIEDLLQEVKVPITVGGSGNPEKDVKVFKKIADIAEGERIVLNSLNLDMKLEEIGEHIRNKDCIVIDFSPMDLDKAREINRKLYDYLPKERIIDDLNIAGIGYGLEYGFTVIERARLSALKGDEELQHPLVAAASNAWAAREAWLKMDPYWGPKEIRGPAWEIITGLVALLAGADYLMVVHPLSLKVLKDVIDFLLKGEGPRIDDIYDWVSAKF